MWQPRSQAFEGGRERGGREGRRGRERGKEREGERRARTGNEASSPVHGRVTASWAHGQQARVVLPDL